MKRTPEEIQALLDAQRKDSKLHQLGDSQIKRTQSIRDVTQSTEWKDNHREAVKNRTSEWRENVSNANKVTVKRRKTKAFYDSRKKLKADPEWQRMMAERNKEMAKDPAWQAAYLEGRKKMDRTKLSDNMKSLRNRDDWDELWKKNRERMKANPEWRKNVIRAKGKPFITPAGVFDTLNNAAEVYNELRNFRNGKKWVYEMLKRGEPGFKHITWEEYDQLVGNSDDTFG